MTSSCSIAPLFERAVFEPGSPMFDSPPFESFAPPFEHSTSPFEGARPPLLLAPTFETGPLPAPPPPSAPLPVTLGHRFLLTG